MGLSGRMRAYMSETDHTLVFAPLLPFNVVINIRNLSDHLLVWIPGTLEQVLLSLSAEPAVERTIYKVSFEKGRDDYEPAARSPWHRALESIPYPFDGG
jgi:hypothetical protein